MYQILKHTADIGLYINASSLEELFKESFIGFKKIAFISYSATLHDEKKISVAGINLEELLVNWLNEINFLLITENIIVDRIKSMEIEKKNRNYSLEAEIIYSEMINSEFEIAMEIKAVTFHDLTIKAGTSGFSTKIYFDI